MRLQNISSIKEANDYLQTSDFIAQHNQQFSVVATTNGNDHKSVENYDLKSIFSIKETRVLAQDFTISYNNQIFQLNKHQRANVYPKNVITVSTDLDGNITLSIRNISLDYTIIKSRQKVIIDEKILQEKIHKPGKNSRHFVGGNIAALNMESRVKSALTAVESLC